MNTSEMQSGGYQETLSKEKIDFCMDSKASNPFSPFSCACFKKCCKKYKKGNRCGKCPKR
ncbi:hypothetical protein [Sphingobacterium faecium]|uniref:hypothetical protein n=1 Tax=Sphingobacterium faecium TaxID=34087 RepID=UPI002469918E|nr:hypothetical protein [Sphingobacterium faecium]MDH5826092.1 hypothetical protein [Sphingobacterium faecium]